MTRDGRIPTTEGAGRCSLVTGRSYRSRLELREGCDKRGTNNNATFTSADVLLTTIGVRFLLAHVYRMPADVYGIRWPPTGRTSRSN